MNKEFKKDDRGVSLVMVISTITIVTLLVTVALVAGLFNYQMKVTNQGSKENFYDAEKVLDEIRLGLQQDVSDAMSQAYVETVNGYSDQSTKISTSIFNDLYVNKLRESLASSKNSSNYDIEYLLSFLDQNVKNHTTLTTVAGKNPKLTVNENGVVLKNLSLTYVDEEDYITKVDTDIQIKIPDMNFSKMSSVPNLLQYCLVGQKGITVSEGTGTVEINGNVYAGTDTKYTSSISIGNGKSVIMGDDKDVISKDNITVETKGTLIGGAHSSVWANDIEVNSGSELQLTGTTYVKNDLTILGGADVTLGGEYYGFGNPKAAIQAESVRDAGLQSEIDTSPADYSSAIIVNGIENVTKAASTLNLENMKRLMLAGNAYIGDSEVFMGESLTVRSNQIAYLVPESCMLGMPNPMSAKERSSMLAATGGETEAEQEALFKSQILMNVRATVSEEVESIEQIYKSYYARTPYYYFMKFSSVKAANDYIASVYQAPGAEILEDYLKVFVNDQELKINPSVETIANGNIMVYDENGISVIGDSIGGGTDISENPEVLEQLTNYQDMFYALNTNLTLSYKSLTNLQRAREGVYLNLFNNHQMWRRITAYGMVLYEEGGKNYVAYFGNNESSTYYINNLKKKAKVQYGDSAELALVICPGNVTVNEDFNGLILCGGRITIKPNTAVSSNIRLNNNPSAVAGLISDAVYENYRGETYTLGDFMYDSEMYTGRVYTTDNDIHLQDLVVYSNWSKQ